MKFRYIGSIAILSAALMAACVSASEDKSMAASSKTQAPQAIQVAANEVTVGGGEVRELDEDGFPIPQQKKKLGKAPPPPKDAMTPMELVKSAPIGTLKNPYKHDLNNMAKWGKARYMGTAVMVATAVLAAVVCAHHCRMRHGYTVKMMTLCLD